MEARGLDMAQASLAKNVPFRDRLLTTREAAEYLGMSTAFLERDRCIGAKIAFVRIGTRTVRYRQRDLDKYVESNQEAQPAHAR